MGGGSQPERPDGGLLGLAPGTVIAGYRVESRIGAGGMAMVFRARDESLGRTVALKVLAPALADDAAFRERFIRESRAAAAVDHPHIIPVHGAGEFEGVLYLAMRYVAGGDLRALLMREAPLPPSRAAFLLSPLASALDAGHAAGLVHRDVKPANILIDTSPGRPDHLYLSDFGLAKGNASTGLTGTGQFLGSVDYCPPEQISGKPARPQTDQYALGCVAYTMFTGTVPFPRDVVTAVLWAHMSEPPPPVTALRPDLPPALDPVLARAMAKDPDERYPSCTEFADALRAAVGLSAYTTLSGYAAAGTGLPPAVGGGLAEPAAAVRPAPVTASTLSVPPVARDDTARDDTARDDTVQDDTVPPSRQVAVLAPPSPGTVPTQSGSSAGFADTAGRAISYPVPDTSPHHAPSPARRRPRRRGVLAAAVVVVAGGVTAAVLALSSPGSPSGSPQGSPPASSTPPTPTLLAAPERLGSPLTEPNPGDNYGAQPTGVAFKSDGTLVTVDAYRAFSWDIASGSYTQTDYHAAAGLTRSAVTVVGTESLRWSSSPGNVVRVVCTATGQVETLAAPSGTVVDAWALSPDGTEAAVADSDGSTYLWKVAS